MTILFLTTVLMADDPKPYPSYPMLMSCRPIAVQAGKTSVCDVTARYSLMGASAVIVSGAGVTATPVDPTAEEKEKASKGQETTLKISVDVSAEAAAGVREFRIVTPQGVSTVGQLWVTPDPVVAEDPKGKNDVLEQAVKIELPCVVTGTIEGNVDVDVYRFSVSAGGRLVFHVLSARLEDKIHDLQTHSDPIIVIKNSAGSTVAQADNVFNADPFLVHEFAGAGDYTMEIRDVRFKSNKFWEYAVEINDRPFVETVYPLVLGNQQGGTVSLIGPNLLKDATSTVPAPASGTTGPRKSALTLGSGRTNPVEVVWTDLPTSVEKPEDNNAIANAQAFTIPGVMNGRMESEADLDYYRFEAKKGERFSFEVLARRYGSMLDPLLAVVNDKGGRLLENDDQTVYRHNFADSRIENWTAPADGMYFLEIRDVHLRGGANFVYGIKAERAEPEFLLFLDDAKTQVTPGVGGVIFVGAVRRHGFDGAIDLSVTGLPAGVEAVCGRILPGTAKDGCIILKTSRTTSLGFGQVIVTGKASVKLSDGNTAERVVTANPLQETYLPGGGRGFWPVGDHVVCVGAPTGIRAVKISQTEVTLKPGETKTIDVEIDRHPDFKDNITLDALFQHLASPFANTLPEGVKIDGKQSKLLLTANESKGKIALQADAKAPPVEKQLVPILAHVAINFVMKSTAVADPVTVTVLPAMK